MAEYSVKKISPKLGGERGTRNPYGPTSSHDLVEQMEFLYVEVIKVINKSVLNPNTHACSPVVEITLGNYMSSTRNLPMGPNGAWNQVFAFDKSTADVLSVALKDNQFGNNILIGKQNFKLAADIPSRVPPDARMAPRWYSIPSTVEGYHMELLMSVWFGTQADEVYSYAWFADACAVHASCMKNTRPEIYLAPRLCYVRVTIVSGHDLFASVEGRTPNVYVKAALDKVCLKTAPSSGKDTSWNKDLIFVVSESLEGTVKFELWDVIKEDHEQLVGTLEKKVSEMTALKVPGAASALFYDVKPPGDIIPAGDSRKFSSRLKMKLSTDQSYHVFDECTQYCSDYRAFAKGLWPGTLGKLEVGFLGATDLIPKKDSNKRDRSAYAVAKYGNKWSRTRTVVNNKSPKWNEQYSWDIYEKCTVLTIGVYDNSQIYSNETKKPEDDVPIGKVRIPLSLLEWNRIYTGSYPIVLLGKEGLKKSGEIQLAIRCACPPPTLEFFPPSYAFAMAPFRWLLPKSHYKSPHGIPQTDKLQASAVEITCLNLARTEPPLREEVVRDMLKPKSKDFSLRKFKANLDRLNDMFTWLSSKYDRLDAQIRSTTDNTPKWIAFVVCFCVLWLLPPMMCLVVYPYPYFLGGFIVYEVFKILKQYYHKTRNGIGPPPPLVLFDLKLSKLDFSKLNKFDETQARDMIAEEFDKSSDVDPKVLKVRYDRLKDQGAEVMVFLGDAASQFERLHALYMLCTSNRLLLICVVAVVYPFLLIYYYLSLESLMKGFITFGVFKWVNFTFARLDLPSALKNFFRRLPSKEYLMI
ncbi:Ca2+dependent plant phosphoribosyltransferase family protein [Hirschfeldia incana]|nr:Ca2+dependent plant phosphoribosyltransferase family protein [Hirschfeldia incana]